MSDVTNGHDCAVPVQVADGNIQAFVDLARRSVPFSLQYGTCLFNFKMTSAFLFPHAEGMGLQVVINETVAVAARQAAQ